MNVPIGAETTITYVIRYSALGSFNTVEYSQGWVADAREHARQLIERLGVNAVQFYRKTIEVIPID